MFKRNELIKKLKIAKASFMFKIQFITVETWVLDAFSLPLLHLASESRTPGTTETDFLAIWLLIYPTPYRASL